MLHNEFFRKTLFLLFLIAIFSFRYSLENSSTGQLLFILSPTAKSVQFFTADYYEYQAGSGYHSLKRPVVIDKECAGLNFFTAALLLSAFFIRRQQLLLYPLSIIWCWLLTILANAIRITASIGFLPLREQFDFAAGSSWTHTITGLTVYFAFFFIYFMLLQKLQKKQILKEQNHG